MKTTVKKALMHSLILGSVLFSNAKMSAGELQPLVQVVIDGQTVDVPLRFGQDGKLNTWSLVGEPLTIGGTDGALINYLTGAADPDPFLGYAIGVTDIGAPSLFGFVFGTPIVPTSPPGTVTSAFSASLTDGPTAPGVISITPAAPGVPVDGDGIPEIHVVTDGFLGGALVNDGADLGPAGAYGAGASVHGPFNEVVAMPGPGPWTWLQINVTFTGSGGGDFYGLTGSAVKAEGVPDTAGTLLLAVLGLAGCALTRRFCFRADGDVVRR